MQRQIVLSGPVKGKLVTGYKNAGPSAATPTNAAHCNQAGGGVHLRGTKTPGGGPT